MTETESFFFDRMDTPLGRAVVIADAQGSLCMHFWVDDDDTWQRRFQQRHAGGEIVERRDDLGHVDALRRYYAGDIAALESIPVRLRGTPFQTKVWSALRTIPAGTTVSYGELARRIDHPTAVRAVGLANGSNPIGVVVPCHRVVGSNGSLTGYGGGIERKRWLLAHEARHTAFRLAMPG